MAVNALVVDLDGTVWDSYGLYADILAEASGVEPQLYIDQLRRGGNVVKLLSQASLSRSAFSAELRRRSGQLDLYEGVDETLAELSALGVPIGVATSLPGWVCDPLLIGTGLNGRFRAVTNASHVRKPAPRAVLRTLGLLESDIEGAWHVGDGTADAECAARAGVQFAWASYGYSQTPPDRLDAVLARFREVMEL